MLRLKSLVLVPIAVVAFARAPLAAMAKTYQVTGPVLAVTDDMIAVQKGKDRWEIGRDSTTKVTGDLKVGSKVTVEYRMTATAIEEKSAGAKAKGADTGTKSKSAK